MNSEKMRFGELVSALCQTNIELWQEEDKARVDDDREVAQAKRRIDKLNQKRNDLIEKIDDHVAQALKSERANYG